MMLRKFISIHSGIIKSPWRATLDLFLSHMFLISKKKQQKTKTKQTVSNLALAVIRT